MDTVRGVPRVRPWPKPKPLTPGSPREYYARYFGAMNRICKAWHPAFMGEAQRLTEGTPYYPRDILLMGMYGRNLSVVMPDGQQWWSMANRATVSASLDVLGNTEGYTLRRGPAFWEAVEPPTALAASCTVKRNNNIASVNASAGYNIVWEAAILDDFGGWTSSPDPTIITLPSGYTRAKALGQVSVSGLATRAEARLIFTGTLATYPLPLVLAQNANNFAFIQVASPWLPYSAGDTVKLQILTPSDTAVGVTASQIFLTVDLA